MPDWFAGFGLPALLVVFGLSAAAVAGAGIVLARTGDAIAERTGLGGLIVGMLLLGGATSLPEIATDVSAALADAPDLAVGDLFGSSMANMAILALVDLLYRGRVWTSVGLGQARLAAVAIALTSVALLALLVPHPFAIGWIGVETIIIVAGYLAATAWIHRTRRTGRHDGDRSGETIAPMGWGEEASAGVPMRNVLVRFALAAGVVLVAAPFVALSAEGIANQTGVGQTFVGTFLLAATTSLPELVASLTAVRIGAYELAVGNLFGSNAFNMVALLAADLAYVQGPILAAVAPAQAVAGVGAVLLMALALAAVIHGTETRIRRLEPDAVGVLLVYVLLLGAVWVSTA
ncbi:MAG: sodium:calcium antiporter [Chloroflexota bacterium]